MGEAQDALRGNEGGQNEVRSGEHFRSFQNNRKACIRTWEFGKQPPAQLLAFELPLRTENIHLPDGIVVRHPVSDHFTGGGLDLFLLPPSQTIVSFKRCTSTSSHLLISALQLPLPMPVCLAHDSLPELKLGEKLGTNADQRYMSLGQIPILLFDLQWSPRGPSSIKVLPSHPYVDTARNPRLPLANSSNSRSRPKIVRKVGFSDVKVPGWTEWTPNLTQPWQTRVHRVMPK